MSSVFDQLTGTDSAENNADAAASNADINPQSHQNPETVSGDQATPTTEQAAPALYTPRDIKNASQELLKYGLLEMANKPKLYQIAVNHQQKINEVLEPFDLSLCIDDIRGLAFLVLCDGAAEEDEWSHPLVRRQRLSLDQSLLLAILRECYITHEIEAGVGNENAIVALDDLRPRLHIYLGDMGSEMAEDKRLRSLLEKLKTHGIVSEVDKFEQITIRPIITHVANPENLKRLLQTLQQHASSPNDPALPE